MISTVCRWDHLRHCTNTLPDCCGLTAAPHQTLKGVGGGGQAALITLFQLCCIFNYIVLSWYLLRSCQFCHNPAHSRNLHPCTNPKENIFCLDIKSLRCMHQLPRVYWCKRRQRHFVLSLHWNLQSDRVYFESKATYYIFDLMHRRFLMSEHKKWIAHTPPTSRVTLIYIDTNLIV